MWPDDVTHGLAAAHLDRSASTEGQHPGNLDATRRAVCGVVQGRGSPDVRLAHESGGEERAGSAVQLERAAVLGDLARAHEDDAVGHREGLALVMCDEHERRAEVTVQPAKLLLHRRSHGKVERCQRLVE